MPDTDDFPQLQEALDASPIEHPTCSPGSPKRSAFAEAEERFEAGRILPALSSLAAVPPLHHMLTERFSGLLLTAEAPELDDADLAAGLYL